MAQNGISINIEANTREAVRGVDDVADAVDQVQQNLRDLTKEGTTATDRMESDFRSVSQSADKTSDDLKAKFRAAYRDVKSSSSSGTDDIVQDQRRLGEKSQEVGQEIRQNLGEGLANAARGDFSQLADTIGDTLGGITASIGGIGTAGIAVAGAIGLGAILGAIQQQQQAADELKQKLVDAYKTASEAGRDYITGSEVDAGVRNDLFDQAKSNAALAEANKLGVDRLTILRAQNGDVQALARVQAAADRNRQEAAEKYQGTITDSRFGGDRSQIQAADQLVQKWKAVGDQYDQNAARAREANRADNDSIRAQIQGLQDVGIEVDGLGNKLITLADGSKVMIDVDTGMATYNVDKFQGDTDGVIDHINGRTAVLNIDTSVAQARLAAIPRNVTANLTLNTSDFDRKLNDAQRRAAAGINVGMALKAKVWQ